MFAPGSTPMGVPHAAQASDVKESKITVAGGPNPAPRVNAGTHSILESQRKAPLFVSGEQKKN